ncbi:MAG: hypothetical protein A3E78_13015 [Alphaproteobacteria bacterium RIFCSPHIGHO2_12_FULL_63_12]|nr:MAG: hypothetical protein A3E78_13015 [Alphaproteobacteria bacterium RIFCSPHIGHO2_12_FULL_63_12]
MTKNSQSRRRRPQIRSGGASAEDGNALLVVIGLVGVLAAIGVAYQATTQSQARLYNALTARIVGQAAVDAAVDLGVWRVVRDWRRDPASLERVDLRCAQDGQVLSVRIENESRRLNVNFADRLSIAREIANAGLAADAALMIAARIADYVDRDSVTSENAPEAEDFRIAGATAAPKNAPLNIIDELRLIPGVDEKTFAALENVLSVHSTRTGGARQKEIEQDDEAPAPRGVYRVTAIAAAADGHPLHSRIAIVELDPARPQAPAIRVWSRAAFQKAVAGGSTAPARACRDTLLVN